MTDHSQNGEQRIILEYFGYPDKISGPRNPWLLDIGANDGTVLSNSRALMELDWAGILVEPAMTPFGKLAALYHDRPDVMCVQAAITTQDGPIDFYDCGVHLHKGDTSLLSTTVPETMHRWKRSGEQFTKTSVRGITFATLMRECGYGPEIPPRFEFITLDAEGADLSIIQQIDLRAVGCRMLCVETNGNDAPFIEYAARHGMRVHRKCVENVIFVR